MKANMGYVIFLAVVAAIGGFLFGYDTAVISGTIGQVGSQFGLDSLASGWYVGCALVGSIAGVLVAGPLGDYLGRKKSMLLSAVLFTVSAAGCAVAPGFTSLVVFRIIGGAGIGIVSIISPLYIAEVSTARHRGTMVLLYQLAITVGFLGAYLANYGLAVWAGGGAAEITAPTAKLIFSDEVWRGMLGMETIPALLFFVLIFFIPESPRWLLLKGHELRSMKVLERIYASRGTAVGEMSATKQAIGTDAKADWRLLLSPGIARAVLIGSAIAILGQFMGVNAVLYYGPTIFEGSGLSESSSLLNQTLVGLVNFLTTVIAVTVIDRVGRKKLVYWGVSGMIAGLLLIAFYFMKGAALGIAPVWLLVFFLFYIFCQAISISAVIFVLLSEMYPIKVRAMAMSISGFSLWVGTYLIGQLTPVMLDGLTPAGTFLLFAAMCVPYMLIVWKLIPETTGRSLEEIERYWTK
jgi:sugar porter (SP) family MFS transporter